MGLVNAVVPLERTPAGDGCLVQGDACALALRPAPGQGQLHAHEDGYAGIQQLAHDANLLFYGSEEAREGREAFKEKRRPDFSKYPRRP